jgi:hypothetical protein
VPYYESRQVEIRFEDWRRTPRITADGPSSPHRYKGNGGDALCIWHPNAPPEEKWEFSDGLLLLINHIQAHLFREAWWRETGEWLGPEAPHDEPKKDVKEEAHGDRDRPDLRS